MAKTTLNPKNLGLAGGIVWGVALFLFTLIAIPTGYGAVFLNLVSSVYIGHSLSVPGAFLGLIYGFIDAFIGVYIFAWLYNWLEKRK